LIEAELELRTRLSEALANRPAPGVDPLCPCFAHLRVEMDGTARDLLLGWAKFLDSERRLTLLTARSPLGRVFFQHEEGDGFEVGPRNQAVAGRVLAKRLWGFQAGQLVRIDTPTSVHRLTQDGWQTISRGDIRLLSAEMPTIPEQQKGPGGRLPALLVASRFDQQQRAVVDHSGKPPLLVTGAAGCGKTTAVLHHVARLHASQPQRFPQHGIQIVVPESRLADLATAVLGDLHLHGAKVATFDQWITEQAGMVFEDLPSRMSGQASATVTKFKRHQAVRALLPILVERLGCEVADRLDRRLAARGRVRGAWARQPGTTLLERLQALRAAELTVTPDALQAETNAIFEHEINDLYAVREDLLRLFGDRELLSRAVAASDGELKAAGIQEVLEHTHIQFSQTADEEFAHVDADARRAIDGLDLDAGTPQEDADTVDVEDYAIAFELLRLKTGSVRTPYGSPTRHACLAADEAQEMAPIELAILRRMLAPEGALIIAGDSAQQIDPAVYFRSWAATMQEVGTPIFDHQRLRTSYRCTAEILGFAAEQLGPRGEPDDCQAARRGLPVTRSCFPTEQHAIASIGAALRDLHGRAPEASVAVIARSPERARELHACLPSGVPARLSLGPSPGRPGGVEVTTVSRVKGLEFDVVIIPDLTPEVYGADPISRRTLYVACTRAVHQLWVVSWERT